MKQLSFDDVLIRPSFSLIQSRKDVSLSQQFLGVDLSLPIISSNMDSVTGVAMAKAMRNYGAIGALHRFWSIEDNVHAFSASPKETFVSIGVGKAELERAEALHAAGANTFIIDVAHGATLAVVQQFDSLRQMLPNAKIIVGNFATDRSIKDFVYYSTEKSVDAFKVGIGGGSACLTRVVTGSGVPTFASVQECAWSGFPIICDGGCRNSGDIAKALGAGASAVMLGGMLAGADESAAEEVEWHDEGGYAYLVGKRYRGSASLESYEDQGKVASWRAAEGDAFDVPATGPVINTLQQIEGGLRSAFSYSGAATLADFRERVEFIEVTPAGATESKAHGKTSII